MIPIVTTNPSKNPPSPKPHANGFSQSPANGGRVTPSSPSTPILSSSSSQQLFPQIQPPDAILFDAPVVARQEPGWEEMLEVAIELWVKAVLDEKRADR